MKLTNFFLFLLINTSLLAQWSEEIVSDNAIMPQKIISADINGDGKMDVVSMNQGSDTINWYKNIGNGNFTFGGFVGNLEEGRDIAVGDIDGDGSVDIIGVSALISPGSINLFMYKNLEGNGTFGPRIPISTPYTIGGQSIRIVDINGDGHNDLLVGTSADRAITWYENIDGNGTFDTGSIIISNYVNGTGIAVGDIDGDGDLDIVAGTLNYNIMSWFENLDGQGTFGSPMEIGSPGAAVLSVFLADIDGDDDLDVIGSAVGAGMFAWWENRDGQGDFSSERIIDSTLVTTYIYPLDLDNDGDIDVLTLAPGHLRWYKNLDSLGNFGIANIIKDDLEFAITVTAADLDNDGDMDPITASQSANTIYWFENDVLNTGNFDSNLINIYPNPVQNMLNIESKIPIYSISFYDVLFRNVLQLNGNNKEINISNLQNGMYFLKISSENGNTTRKILKE